MSKAKTKIKTVVAEVRENIEYIAGFCCPYCKAYDSEEIEEDDITIPRTCRSCNKKYKVKIPKNALL